MRWGLLLPGAACIAVFSWAVGCATGTVDPDMGNGDTTGGMTCKQQSDCGGSSSFCEPVSAGSTDGVCVPRSSVHCLACAKDSDCGTHSAACFQAAGDSAPACRVDCALSGSNACPEDYTCADQ